MGKKAISHWLDFYETPDRHVIINPYPPAFPPPSGGGVAVTAQTLGTLRNNYDQPVGLFFTVGPSPITVTELGRWVISGNTLTHALTLRDSANTILGTVNVVMAGAPPGDYFYGSLLVPVVLSAGTKYYLLSKEENSGDEWYDGDTLISVSSDLTLPGLGYIAAGILVDSTPDHAAVPLNFKYTV